MTLEVEVPPGSLQAGYGPYAELRKQWIDEAKQAREYANQKRVNIEFTATPPVKR